MRQEQDNMKKRDRRLLGVAGGIFALSLCGFGGFWYLQHRPAPDPLEKLQVHLIADISPAQKAKFVDRAKMLREKWRPWALKHQAELKRMMQAGPDDKAAMLAVWNQIPWDPHELNLSPEDLTPSGSPIVGVGFGWSALDKVLGRGSPPPANAAPVLQKMALTSNWRVRHEFETQRDISIADGGMSTQTLLWASGRITQRSTLPEEEFKAMLIKAAHEKGGYHTTDDEYGPIQELVPPFDFLTSS